MGLPGSRAQAVQTLPRGCCVKQRAAARQCQRTFVVAGSGLRLSKLIEAHREVVGIVGIRGFIAYRFKKSLLRLWPAPGRDILQAECKMQMGSAGLLAQQVFESGFPAGIAIRSRAHRQCREGCHSR